MHQEALLLLPFYVPLNRGGVNESVNGVTVSHTHLCANETSCLCFIPTCMPVSKQKSADIREAMYTVSSTHQIAQAGFLQYVQAGK